MLEALMISSAISVLAMLFSLVVFLTGVVVVVRGKFTISRHTLRGGGARLAGVYLIAQFALGMLIYSFLHNSLSLGSSATAPADSVEGKALQGVGVLLVTVAAIVIVRSMARSRKLSSQV